MSVISTLNPEQRETLKKAVDEAVGSLYRQDAEKELRKEIAKRMKEEIELTPATFNKLAAIAYRDSGRKLNEETTELLDLAEELGFYSHPTDDEGGE